MLLPGHFTAVKYYCGKGVKRKKKERKENREKVVRAEGVEPSFHDGQTKVVLSATVRAPIGGGDLRLSPNL